jgi:hypothetical protein
MDGLGSIPGMVWDFSVPRFQISSMVSIQPISIVRLDFLSRDKAAEATFAFV